MLCITVEFEEFDSSEESSSYEEEEAVPFESSNAEMKWVIEKVQRRAAKTQKEEAKQPRSN